MGQLLAFALRRCLYGFFAFALLCSLLNHPQRIFAAGEFQADYDVQYAITPAGKTIVTQHVSLINKLSNYYPKQYSLLLDSDKISNVIAYDDGGVITPVISVKDGKTEITLAFNVKSIGLGKASTFSLRYEHSGVAAKNGSIWEIYVPGITNDPDIGQYNVTLAVPPTFGPSAYLSPPPANNTTWNKDQMIRGGISGAYGNSQNFLVNLTYSLANTSMVPQDQQITLPPDTAYQKVTLDSLTPKPKTVTKDADGNWLARYSLLPRETLPITAKVRVSTYLTPRKEYVASSIDASSYLTSRDYWAVSDPKIQQLAQDLHTPKQIYEYVASALTYDYTRANTTLTRLGAVGALAHPTQAVCTEFTDLFIAISRAAGIPARRNVGYAYTNNAKLRPLSLISDVLHAWPEYFDTTRSVWVPIDPTWANTTGGADYFSKLDYNHIVFAINGADSSLPYPAGFYHAATDLSKHVDVTFAAAPSPDAPSVVSSKIEFPSQVGAGTSTTGAIVVTNTGGQSAYTIAVSAVSDVGDIRADVVIPELLPFATLRVPLQAKFPQSFSTSHGTITSHVNEALSTYSFTVQPLYWLISLGVLFVILASIVLFKLIQLLVWKVLKKR